MDIPLKNHPEKIKCTSLEAMQQAAIRIAEKLQPRDVVLLTGALGAGKTTLARFLIQYLVGTEIPVPSPTFTLVQSYETKRGPVHHFDLYRLKDPDDIFEIGFEEARASGICLIEWPDRLGPYTPRDALRIHIHDTTERLIQIER